MAEFSLGLTKTAVEGTVSLVKSTIEEEEKLKEKVQNDLVFITGEFEVMQSFLHHANRDRAANDKVAVALVNQLRTLAFDVEDWVEYVVHLDLDTPSPWGWLRRLWQTANCRAPRLPLDVAVAEIRQLKARVEEVSKRNKRYNHLLHGSVNNIKQEPAVPVVMPPPPLAQQPADATTYHSSSASAFRVLRDSWEATGKWRKEKICNLQELICSEDGSLQVISVWGTGSQVGDDLATATSILNKAYWDQNIGGKFTSRAWVKLTHPFNHADLVNNLLAQLYASSSSHQANEGGDEGSVGFRQDKLAELNIKMGKQKCLVVLENVLAVAEWNMIKIHLPQSNNGSRIVVLTPRLPIAVLCTGEPYQVSELTKFYADNQFLGAFFQNKAARDTKPSDEGKFYHQLRHDRVILVTDGDDKSNLVGILYEGIINGWFKKFEPVSDDDKAADVNMRHSWVDVPHSLDLKVFARHLFLNFLSDDNIRAREIRRVGNMGEAGLIQWCRESLFEQEDCLVVINGVQSMEEWERIKDTFLSSHNDAAAKKVCMIIVVTNKEAVATELVEHHSCRAAFNVDRLMKDASISTLVHEAYWYYYGIGGRKGRLFYDRKKDEHKWTDKFKNGSSSSEYESESEFEYYKGKDKKEFGVFRVAVEGPNRISILRHQGILRDVYYGALSQKFERRSWVDVGGGWSDLLDFSWRLLLDFHCDESNGEKEKLAVGLMEGTITEPTEKCNEILRTNKCLVVIHGLIDRSQWEKIKRAFFSDEQQHIKKKSIIIVSSFHPEFNSSCELEELPLVRNQRSNFTDAFDEEYRHIFGIKTKRCEDAATWNQPVVGRQRETMDHLTMLLGRRTRQHPGQSGPSLVSVWGIPGVGKSHLIRSLYYDQIMLRSSAGPPSSLDFGNSHDFQAFGWVDVTSPFNLTDFAWGLLLDLDSEDPQAKEAAAVSMMEQGHDPILECRKILHGKKCLVVINGLGSMQDWNSIKDKLLSKEIDTGTAVVVITTEEKVAMHCVKEKEPAVNIGRLDDDAALKLFKKIAWGDRELTPGEMEISKSIVNKCGGLYKVIAAIGETCDEDSGWLQYLNDNFMVTLEREPKFHGLGHLFSWMHSRVHACSDSIKQCIFYLSIFPPEKNIRSQRLLWRWIAEGYCRDTSDGRNYEETGKIFKSELIKWIKSLQLSSDKGFGQIDGFFREYITQPMEDNRVFALDGRCSVNSQRGGQHLTIRSSWDRNKIVYESIDFSRLRSLTVFGKWESFFVSKEVKMRLVRVLDLEDAEGVTNDDLKQIAKLLIRLKFLSLRGQININYLPNSVGFLRHLQTLDIRGTSIKNLPPFITKLQKLLYIRAGTSEVWDWDVVPADGKEDGTSSSSAQAVTAASSSSVQAVTAASSSSAQAVTAAVAPVPAQDGTEAPVTAQDGTEAKPVSCNNWPCPCTGVPKFLSKCKYGGGQPSAAVTVPKDIGNLKVLHTLGVVKVNARRSKAIFKELEKLTQLRKLSVSGINKRNIKGFCSAISKHAHLRSLSVELDKDDDLDDVDIPKKEEEMPPKTITSLKLCGHVHKLVPVWMKHFNNLEKLCVTIEKSKELPDSSSIDDISPHLDEDKTILRIRSIQDGELHIHPYWSFAGVLEIQCSSMLHIKFGDGYDNTVWQVRLLKVYFSDSTGSQQSSLKISGLRRLWYLKEVWLKGHTNAHKEDMRRIVNTEWPRWRPQLVLKLVQPSPESVSKVAQPPRES